MLSLLTALVLTQSAPKFDEQTQCRKDSDCVISTTQCCPGCCGTGPYPTTRAAEKKMNERCAVIECSAPAKCDIVCEPPARAEAFKAKCVKNECRMVAR